MVEYAGRTWRGGSDRTAIVRTSDLQALDDAVAGAASELESVALRVGADDLEITDSAKGLILKSPDGTRYRVTVANGGTLSVGAA